MIALVVTACAALVVLAPVAVSAQDGYPKETINILHGFGAGGPSDLAVRLLLRPAERILGKPIVVLNKPGAASAISLTELKNAKPDGYTLGSLLISGLIAQHMQTVGYDVTRDFTPIIQFSTLEYAVSVRPDAPWKTFRELVDHAKQHPGKVNFSTAGTGNPQSLVITRLGKKHGIKWTQVPFNSGAENITAVLGGHVSFGSTSSEFIPHALAGRVRLLAVMHEKRLPKFPDVPTLKELGYDMVAPTVQAVLGPKNLPRPIVDKLHDAFKKAMADPEFIKGMEAVQPVFYRGPDELAQFLKQTSDEWGPVIREASSR